MASLSRISAGLDHREQILCSHSDCAAIYLLEYNNTEISSRDGESSVDKMRSLAQRWVDSGHAPHFEEGVLWLEGEWVSPSEYDRGANFRAAGHN